MSSKKRQHSGRRKPTRRAAVWKTSVHVGDIPNPGYLLHARDSDVGVVIDPARCLGVSPGRGTDCWNGMLEGFRSRNLAAFEALGIQDRVEPDRMGSYKLTLHPGLRIGAIPIVSHLSNKTVGGLIVEPRFGWTGIGSILSATGWMAAPKFADLPIVPGSGREIPPWVLAGPVIQRLAALLRNLRPGYYEKTEVRSSPRGQILWNAYIHQQLATGRWHQIPCRYTELEGDTRLKQAIRWVLEKVSGSLRLAGGRDSISAGLLAQITQLLELLCNVSARKPQSGELEHFSSRSLNDSKTLAGIQAINWVIDERGLGGGQTSDGLAWTLDLEVLWERYVEAIIRKEAALSGGRVKTGRLGETTVPLIWHDYRHSLTHLVPDLIVHRAESVEIVDAKYKAHFAEINSSRWAELVDETRDSMRADIHQILAYAATEGGEKPIAATLMYPVYQSTFEDLSEQGRSTVSATIQAGAKNVTLNMRAIPFGAAR